MKESEQISLIRNFYNKQLAIIYERSFAVKLSLVLKNDFEWYNNAIEKIELISSVIELSLASGIPKRALKYCIILDYSIHNLISRTDTDYKLINNKLIKS